MRVEGGEEGEEEEREGETERIAGKESDGGREERAREKRKEEYKKSVGKKGGAVPLLRASPTTSGLLGTWRQPQLEPCPQPRLSPGQGWLHNGGGRRPAGCHVGAGWGLLPGVAGTQLQPGGQSVPRCTGGCKRRWFLSAVGLREGTPSSRPARWLQHALW